MNNTLHGLRVLNTRPLDQNAVLSQAILAAGGIAIDFPALTIVPTTHTWLKQLPSLSTIQQAIFISTNAVDYFFRGIKQQQIAWPDSIQTYAIGKATAAALSKWHIQVKHIPSVADSEHLLQLDAVQQVRGQTILLVKGEDGRVDITDTLEARGANLISVDVYRRALPQIDQKYTYSLWKDDGVDIILFTSQQAMHNLFTLFAKEAHDWLRSKPCLVISERLAQAAFKLGIQTIVIGHYDAILTTLEHYMQGLSHD